MKSLLLLLCLLPCLASAHHEHLALTATAKVGLKAAETALVAGATQVTTTAVAAQKIDWVIVFKQGATSHLHNKVVHFPIALGLVGILFLLLSMKFEGLRSAGRWLLFLAAVAAVAAIFTGRAQQDDVDSPGLRQVLEVHKGLGLWVCIGLWLTWLLSFMKSSYRWLWLLLFLLALAIIAEGNLGGILAHMEI